MIVYHGTSSLFLNPIRKSGLKISIDVGWAERKGVYFTTDYNYARIYAMQTAYGSFSGDDDERLIGGKGGKPIVVVCDIPNNKLIEESKSLDNDTFISPRKVHSEKIIKIIFCRVIPNDFKYMDLAKYEKRKC